MHHPPKRARTTRSGACSHCVRQRERCYIGVKGVPCSSCRRLDRPCDAGANIEAQGRRLRPPLIFCSTEVFASQMRRAELEQPSHKSPNPAVLSTHPLENYILIVNQLLSPDCCEPAKPAKPLPPARFLQPDERSVAALAPAYVSRPPSPPCSIELTDDDDELWQPSPAFHAELLKSYIYCVHPQVPVLDLQSFLGDIGGQHGGERTPSLLFYAAMLAASTFVDLAHIHREGYASRQALRGTLSQTVKTLLNMNCEEDRLTTIQVLLLLIHWNDGPDAEEDTRHWTALCVSLAVSIGLHRDPISARITHARRQTRRRTFWSLYNHMRMTETEDDDCTWAQPEVPMVTLDDFPLGVFSPQAQAAAGHCDVLQCIESQRTQAILFIEKTRLCRLTRFSRITNGVRRLIQGADTAGIWPDQQARAGEAQGLRRWRDQLPPAARHNYPLVLTPSEWERSIYLHRTWLRLLALGPAYAAAYGDPATADESPVDSPSRTAYGEADRHMAELTDLFDELDSLGLAEQLPWPSTALLVLVLAYHRRPVDRGAPSAQRDSARTLHRVWNMVHRTDATSPLAGRTMTLLNDGACTGLWERLWTLFPS